MEEQFKRKLVIFKGPVYPENNFTMWARICFEGMENVSKPLGNIFTVSCEVHK